MVNHLVGLYHYRNQMRRAKRLQRQRDGLTNNEHTLENVSRRAINDFLNRIRKISEQEKRNKWTQEGPEERRGPPRPTLRQVKFDRYEENNQMRPKNGIWNQIAFHIKRK